MSLEHIAFMGNDVNDLPALEIVGIPILVLDATPHIYDTLLHKLEFHITRSRGGEGAVREVCEMIIAAKEQNAPNRAILA